ncbi:LPS-assembly protein LptD [Amorphus orientalis]|uniref:LPS-assembly protein LptD n=1 Tax=Amorphus orientalis TaxID=649198 RepID=A0AAE4ARZ4_9HYPH|nr:LPS-assembly protein LptD [Amorphus orientalis]MDQ0315626.1 LPS-assembly protein [Amorphus orientalis]
MRRILQPGQKASVRRLTSPRRGAGVLLALVLTTALIAPPLALAQDTQEDDLFASAAPAGDSELVLQADELIYDRETDVISAVGNVEMYYNGYTLFANRVKLDRTTGRFTAENGAKLTEPDGNIIVAETISLTDDFRDGFVNSLRIDTPERTRLAAERAEREDGTVTTLHRGVYTACYSCLANPDRPPTWQIKATKIVHDKDKKTITYRGPRFEFWGVPVAYFPYFSHPDPSQKRRSGFLRPAVFYSEDLGAGASIPYYWAPAESWDVTFTATPMSRQGVLLDVEYRQQLRSGEISIRGAGIKQLDPSAFAGTAGDTDYRGAIVGTGRFTINQYWTWGWDAAYFSDVTFASDYAQLWQSTSTSQIFLTGIAGMNYFDARAMAYQVLREDYTYRGVTSPPIGSPFTPTGIDQQEKQPYVHPVVDYKVLSDQPILGGQFSYDMNLTSLTRDETDAIFTTNGQARFRGVAGTFTRTSAKADWRRQLIDPIGQIFTPFVSAQADLFMLDSTDPNVTALADETLVGRAMPTAGVEYRYPWLSAHSWGTQLFEPVAQVIARPDETGIGELPNEDAQSIVFDDTTLFQADKFSGFDRVEGGTRANLGLRYTASTYGGGFLSGLIGQSYQLAGKNSYSAPGILDATEYSGLEDDASDYVASLYLDTNMGLNLSAQGRLDSEDLEPNRFEAQATGVTGPVTSQVIYAFMAAQPDLGITEDRREVQGAANLRFLRNWRLYGRVRYDLEDSGVVRDGFGVGYDDDSMSVSLTFSEDRGGYPTYPVDRTVFFRFGLRTLGDTDLSTGLVNDYLTD